MVTCIVSQPNGLFARFSEDVVNFTHYNMSADEAEKVCMENGCSPYLAKAEVLQGAEDRNPHELGRIGAGLDRWEHALRLIETVHGKIEAKRAISLATPVSCHV